MSSHIRSMCGTLFRVTVSMTFCGGGRLAFRRLYSLLVPLSRPCPVLSFVLSTLYLKVYHWQGRENAQVRRRLSFIMAKFKSTIDEHHLYNYICGGSKPIC